ncbi:MAG: carboxypeptidase-like regulatory domain-containing protein [Thermoguttaceae bacterium]|nr:carboxypeptidase-like regulatory domain-containing protein [Thermoguttaceae bacterium]MDW8079990.1 hypothetical protein [Thermoguttaceae bacterium]
MNRFGFCAFGFAVIGLVFWAAGCGQSGPKLVPVSGRVTIGGRPVANVAVFFIGPDKKTIGVGKTDSDGRYQLQNGALAGTNQVYFSTGGAEVEDPAQLAVVEAAGTQAPAKTKSPIPAKFLDPLNPQLTFNVPAGGTTEANFDLTP